MFNLKLKKEIADKEREIQYLKEENRNFIKYKVQNDEIRAENLKIVAECNELKNKVREQTEADLLLVSQRLCNEIINGKKKHELQSYANMQNQLRAQLQSQQANVYGYGNGNLLSNLYGRIIY